MYLYPINFTDELDRPDRRLAARSFRISTCRLQHISDAVLKRMQRRVNRRQTVELVEKLRERIPNVVLRTTFITGFPGRDRSPIRRAVRFRRGDPLRDGWGSSRIRSNRELRRSNSTGTCLKRSKNARRDRLMELQQRDRLRIRRLAGGIRAGRADRRSGRRRNLDRPQLRRRSRNRRRRVREGNRPRRPAHFCRCRSKPGRITTWSARRSPSKNSVRPEPALRS